MAPPLRPPVVLVLSFLLTLLWSTSSEGLVNPTSSEDEWISSLVELLELDYEDQCVSRAEAEWSFLNARKSGFEDKMEAEKAFGDFARTQVYEVREAKNDQHEESLLKRKVELIANPGDTLLDTDQWNKLVTFSGTVRHELENATDYDCKVDQPKNCTLAELQSTMATSRDRHLRLSAKASWERKLPDETKYAAEILPLLKNASRNNGFDNVEDYWEMMAEYPGAFTRAKELWEEIEPLYIKLQKYVALRLQHINGSMDADGSIPVHLLGSLLGDDWSNMADVILPHQLIINEIQKNLKEKHIGGRESYKVASRMLQTLGLGDLKENFWRGSIFDKTCPVRLVNFCESGTVQAFTCNEITIPNFLDAHEVVMSVKHTEMTALLMANTHMLRDANRYSALHEALAGLASVLAIAPKQLERAGLLPSKLYQQPANQHKNAISLQLYYALRDLPRLAYYLDVDLWRLKMVSENAPPAQVGSSWAAWRRNHSFVSPSNKDILGDPYVIANKPYIAKFLGGIIKYQIKDSFTDDMYDIDGDVVQHIALNNNKLKNVLNKGFNKQWPALLDDGFHINLLNSEPLLDHFQVLSEFLDTELEEPGVHHDPDADNYFNLNTNDNEDDGLDDNDLDAIDEEDLNAEPEDNYVQVNEPELQNVEDKQRKAEHSQKLAKEGPASAKNESSPNPNLIPKEEAASDPKSSGQSNENPPESVQKSSAWNYAWIALGVFLAIVLILVIVIARKRYNHRKDLERQRREGATA